MIKQINGKWYRYWDGEELSEIPSGCQILWQGDWELVDDTPPGSWSYALRRWPIPEWQAKSELYCQLHGITVPDDYEVIGYDCKGPNFLTAIGTVVKRKTGPMSPIVRERKRWVIPTSGPKLPCVQVRDDDDDEWEDAELLCINDGENYPYIAFVEGKVDCFQQCQMEESIC